MCLPFSAYFAAFAMFAIARNIFSSPASGSTFNLCHVVYRRRNGTTLRARIWGSHKRGGLSSGSEVSV